MRRIILAALPKNRKIYERVTCIDRCFVQIHIAYRNNQIIVMIIECNIIYGINLKSAPAHVNHICKASGGQRRQRLFAS